MTRAYDKIFELMWYQKMPCFDVNATTSNFEEELGILQYCSWKGIRVPCSAIFDSFPTDSGICCSFNMKSAEEIFRKSQYTDVVSKLSKRDKAKSFEDSQRPRWFTNNNEPQSRPGRAVCFPDFTNDIFCSQVKTKDFLSC